LSDTYRIAFIDIETRPNLSYTWGKWEQNVIAFKQEWAILSFAVKWSDSKRVKVYGLPDFPLYDKDPDNDLELIKELWRVFNEADLIIGHNGDNFDIKKANARFIFHGLAPTTPYKTVDTLKLARRHFAFNSNKLDDLAKYFGIGEKVKTGGASLWLDCMNGDLAAWSKMKKYNAHDVILLEKVYNRFRPWHTTHPNINLQMNPRDLRCPACGSLRVQRRGWDYIRTFRAQRYRCLECSKWSRGSREKIPGNLLT
jgi:DNA-directed RNA polymerase subunit RPC12/RpoP